MNVSDAKRLKELEKENAKRIDHYHIFMQEDQVWYKGAGQHKKVAIAFRVSEEALGIR